jgi:two-component sensor histidine kinase
MPLTYRLIALTLAASLPALAALIYNAIDLRNTRTAEVHAEVLRNARNIVSEIDQLFDGIEGALHAVSQAGSVRGNDTESCNSYVSRVLTKLEAITSILVLDTEGKVRCSSQVSNSAANLADRDYFTQALATKKFTIGTYTESRVSARHIVPMALPVAEGGDIKFLIIAGLNLEWLGTQVRERGLSRGSAVTIADRNNIVLAREPFPERFVGAPIPAQFDWLTNGPSGSTDIHSRDGVDRILGHVPARETPFGFYVSTGMSREAAFGPINRALRNSILLYALGIAIAFVLAWIVGEIMIRRPLLRMVGVTEAWRHGQDAVRVGMSGRGDEIGILGQAFDRLQDENVLREEQRAIAEERREILVHELAHRVKNTLATVQSIASMSFRHSQGPVALQQFQDRLQALVRGHDLLTQKNWQHADLSEVAEAAMAPMREERAHRITISGPPVDLPPTSAVPMAMILHELCTNALKYGALSNEHGRINIGWTATPDKRGVAICLTWRETGGPPVKTPEHEGFGSRLITSLTQQLHGNFHATYAPEGFSCEVNIVTPEFEARD